MGSRRLPGKMLMDLVGRPLLGRVLDRVRRVRGSHPVVVATSDQPEDGVLADYAQGEGAQLFRGSLDDVAGRALACCEAYGFSRLARICGDRPFLPWELLDELLEIHAAGAWDLATNAQEPGFPAGTVTDIVSAAALRRVTESTTEPADREHVTRFFYANPGEFRIANRRAEHPEWGGLNLCIDTAADRERALWILGRLGPEPEAAPLAAGAALAAEWEAAH